MLIICASMIICYRSAKYDKGICDNLLSLSQTGRDVSQAEVDVSKTGSAIRLAKIPVKQGDRCESDAGSLWNSYELEDESALLLHAPQYP